MPRIPSKNRDGDCYEVAGRYIVDQGFHGKRSLVLVHGLVTGQGAIAGVRMTQSEHRECTFTERNMRGLASFTALPYAEMQED
jgi:hypothetical protein